MGPSTSCEVAVHDNDDAATISCETPEIYRQSPLSQLSYYSSLFFPAISQHFINFLLALSKPNTDRQTAESSLT